MWIRCHYDGFGHRQGAGGVIGCGGRALDQAVFKGGLDRSVIPGGFGNIGEAGIGLAHGEVFHAAGSKGCDAQAEHQAQGQNKRKYSFHTIVLSADMGTEDRPMAGLPQFLYFLRVLTYCSSHSLSRILTSRLNARSKELRSTHSSGVCAPPEAGPMPTMSISGIMPRKTPASVPP